MQQRRSEVRVTIESWAYLLSTLTPKFSRDRAKDTTARTSRPITFFGEKTPNPSRLKNKSRLTSKRSAAHPLKLNQQDLIQYDPIELQQAVAESFESGNERKKNK